MVNGLVLVRLFPAILIHPSTHIQVPFLNLSTVSIHIDNSREEANHQPLQPTANSISWATATHK